MLDSQIYRKLSLTAAVLGFLTAAACSNHAGPVASRGSVGGAGTAAAAVSPAADAAVASQANAGLRLITLPEGTTITATVGQTLTSDKNRRGDSFVANIAKPVKVDGRTVLPQGTEVTGRIVKLRDRELKVVLASVVVDGVYCDLKTNARRPSDKDQPNRKNSNRRKQKNNSVLSAKTRLTFKLSKPATIPAKA